MGPLWSHLALSGNSGNTELCSVLQNETLLKLKGQAQSEMQAIAS